MATRFTSWRAALEGQCVSELTRVRLLPDDAFGRRETELLHEAPLDALPPGEDIATSKSLIGLDEQVSAINFHIMAIANGLVKLDANHPLAGETLIFELEIQSIRDASAAEIAQAEAFDLQSRVA